MEEGGDGPSRLRLGGRGDGIFQVQDHGIGTGAKRFLHPVRPVAGHEEEGAQLHAWRRCINAVRSITQTSSSRWLSMRCWKVTIPASGRDYESLSASTSVSALSVSPTNTGLGIRTLS